MYARYTICKFNKWLMKYYSLNIVYTFSLSMTLIFNIWPWNPGINCNFDKNRMKESVYKTSEHTNDGASSSICNFVTRGNIWKIQCSKWYSAGQNETSMYCAGWHWTPNNLADASGHLTISCFVRFFLWSDNYFSLIWWGKVWLLINIVWKKAFCITLGRSTSAIWRHNTTGWNRFVSISPLWTIPL